MTGTKEDYLQMQTDMYTPYFKHGNEGEVKHRCVGNWDAHELYPYEQKLLEGYEGPRTSALDFGCGPGRMIKRMLKHFEHVDGADFMAQNFQHAKEYLGEGNTSLFFETDGLSAKIPVTDYDFIFSTICIQHIASHTIRNQILVDLFKCLRPGGEMSIQMGSGWDTGIGWFEDKYDAKSTNGIEDVGITNIQQVVHDLSEVTGGHVTYKEYVSPHPQISAYHPRWIFFHITKK